MLLLDNICVVDSLDSSLEKEVGFYANFACVRDTDLVVAILIGS